jgi:undecaprenyl-phosphate 4-deoxy-4-formamido-L-arabinose transferase
MTASDTQSERSDLREVIDVSVVIPCYRDEKGLPNLLARLAPAMTALGLRCELVLVDDGSPDRTGERAVALSSDFPHPVTVVRLARNFGQHPAVFAGLQHSVGRVVVTMDSDLQYPPEEMATLIGALSDEYPVVSGYRAKRKDPPLRRILSRSISWWLGRRTGAKLRDFGSMFRA